MKYYFPQVIFSITLLFSIVNQLITDYQNNKKKQIECQILLFAMLSTLNQLKFVRHDGKHKVPRVFVCLLFKFKVNWIYSRIKFVWRKAWLYSSVPAPHQAIVAELVFYFVNLLFFPIFLTPETKTISFQKNYYYRKQPTYQNIYRSFSLIAETT